MNDLKRIKLSVHGLVDFLLRRGDIDTRVFSDETMNEGTRIHAFYQRRQGHNYLSEYFLGEEFYLDNYIINLEGRADGIILSALPEIDEIKSTIAPLEEFYQSQKEWHLGQAKCYALMYAHQENLKHIGVRLTYISQLDNSKLIKTFVYNIEDLEEEINGYLKEYLAFYANIENHLLVRNQVAAELSFPFLNFRKGQRMLARYAYSLTKKGGEMFIEAPTGIGKTISTLFPVIKAFKDNYLDKIFYLTAKSSGKETATSTLNLLIDQGMPLRYIVIKAKEKVCFTKKKECNPDKCPFTIDYYTKLRRVITSSLEKYRAFDNELIDQIAKEEVMCPFELSLDLSLYADVIIADYNYVFDPQVYLKRFFDENIYHLFFLIDEAHNLVERGREMYGANISYHDFKETKYLTKLLPENKSYARIYRKLNKLFKQINTEYAQGNILIDDLPDKMVTSLASYLTQIKSILKNNDEIVNEQVMNFFFAVNRFLLIYDELDASSALYLKNYPKDCSINIYCLDPSSKLRRAAKKAYGKLYFSATLTPINYYIDLLGGDENDPFLALPSPFKKENLAILIASNISIKYKNRDSSYHQVAEYIQTFIAMKKGNYFVYFPSYEYLEKILPFLSFPSNYEIFIQTKDMSEEDKNEFLGHFQSENIHTTIGLVIIGGAFSEGIDLVNDRLIGVVVVGVGLPQISYERDLIRNYYDKNKMNGFIYSYVNIGLNKVMQAVGRLIRTPNDVGAALLIDDRYLQAPYNELFKDEWDHYRVITNQNDLEQELQNFYQKHKI